MSTYIVLINFTDQGIRNVKDSPNRLEAARGAIAGLGGEMTSFYLTMGAYDLVAVVEFPNDEAAAKFALAVGSQGNIRTTTLRAFDEAQYREIIAALP